MDPRTRIAPPWAEFIGSLGREEAPLAGSGILQASHRADRTRRPQKSGPSRTSLVAPTSQTERGRGQAAGNLPIRLVLRPVIPDRPPP